MKVKKLKKGQAYYMFFYSGFRDYFSIGTDLETMAINILNRYNRYCSDYDKIDSLEKMAKHALEEDLAFQTYIIDLNAACDMDYRDFDNEIYLGNYLDLVKKTKENNKLDTLIEEATKITAVQKQQKANNFPTLISSSEKEFY